MTVLWFQKNQDTFPLPVKYSNMPLFKNKKQWVWNLLQSRHWTGVWDGEIFISLSGSNSLPCFALSDLTRTPVRLPASQGKGTSPSYAQCFTKMIRGGMLFLLVIEEKKIATSGEKPKPQEDTTTATADYLLNTAHAHGPFSIFSIPKVHSLGVMTF